MQVHLATSILILAFLMFLPPATAQLQIEERGCLPAPADFTARIVNEHDFEDTFGVTAGGSYREWVIFERHYITLGPGESGTISFRIYPPKKAASGKYDFDILAFSLQNKSAIYEEEACIFVITDYLAVIKEISFEKKVDPNSNLTLNVVIKNIGTKDLEEVITTVKVLGLEKQITTSLISGEEKSLSFVFWIGRYTPPRTYDLSISLSALGRVLDERRGRFDVAEIEKTEESAESTFLLLVDLNQIIVQNVGNIPLTRQLEVEIKKPLNFFVIPQGNPFIREVNGKVVYSWPINLNPGEQTIIRYRIDYWPILLILITFVMAIYWFSLTLQLPQIKKILVQKGEKVMVTLDIKNRANKNMTKVVICDEIPPFARLIKKFHTLKPKVSRSEHKTDLRWSLEKLKPKEERIITYEIERVIGSLDHFILPAAKLLARIDKKKLTISSNKPKMKGF